MRILFWPTALVLGLPALLAGPALGEGPGVLPGIFGAETIALLLNKSVQDELKLDKDQLAKLARAEKLLREKYDFSKLRDMKPADRDEFFKKLAGDARKVGEDILKTDQARRFRQIELQHRSALAFTDTDIRKALQLTDEQESDLKEIAADLSKDIDGLRKSIESGKFDPKTFREAVKKMQLVRDQALAKAVKLLDAAQQKQWKELTGDRLEIKWEVRPVSPESSPSPKGYDSAPEALSSPLSLVLGGSGSRLYACSTFFSPLPRTRGRGVGGEGDRAARLQEDRV